jgi:DNA-binding MarR family transcriptional regulator
MQRTVTRPLPSAKRSASHPALNGTVHDLAHFRYALRKFLRFSENAARACGITPQQHQLMLGIAGFTDRQSATISELAEFLQEKNHSVVGLVERAVQSGLVRRAQDITDRRVVIVRLTRHGEAILARLAKLHHEEAGRIPGLTSVPNPTSLQPSPALRTG